MQKQKTSKREWVKTFAIIFLVILLILTFFSQTIMNRSLPEVAVQAVTSGTINAKIRGTGTVSADETYDVTINQTRKVRSVMVKVGDQVATGDTLFVLEPSDSDELKAAQDSLDQMELSYQKSLIEASNSASTENRDVQKLQEAYNEALATYNLYSTADPSKITMALEEAKVTLTDLQRAATDAEEELTEAQKELSEAQQAVSEAEAQITVLEGDIATWESKRDSLTGALDTLASDKYIHEENYTTLENYAKQINKNNYYYSTANCMAAFAKDTALLKRSIETAVTNNVLEKNALDDTTEERLNDLSLAYTTLTADISEVMAVLDNPPYLENVTDIDTIYDRLDTALTSQSNSLDRQISDANYEIRSLSYASDSLSSLESKVERKELNSKDAQRAVEDQQALVEKYTQASGAAEALKAAEEALEDKVFSVNLGDSSSLDLKAAKEAIDEQQKLVDELTANADGQEVTANVSGIISAINVSAGNTAGADMAMATITVADRGYTVNISVTNEQARQVTIGDTASISNYYYGNMTATLENIVNDPQNMGQGKILIFRLSGDGIQAGSNITLSIGQKSANYDSLIPNSAIRTDSNGSFVLVVMAKSSPLGNRYVATRADITVLASDDTSSAVSGLAYGDFVITTSSQPLEAGEQVRLVDN